jgi:Arc/MetJ-type ribon-helix-helix transcriptional regulator
MTNKHRLSASVDASLIAAAEAAISRGRAPNLSAWVNDALRLKLEHDQRMAALDELLSAYEAKHGVITDDELAAASRWARTRAVVVRDVPLRPQASRKARKSA